MATYCKGTKDGQPCHVNESTLSAQGYLDGSCDHCWWINEKAAGRMPQHRHCDCSTCNGTRVESIDRDCMLCEKTFRTPAANPTDYCYKCNAAI